MPYETLLLEIWSYIANTLNPVGVLLCVIAIGLVGAFIWAGIKLYESFALRIGRLEKDVTECHVQRDDLRNRVNELEAQSRQKDRVIDQLKQDLIDMKNNADQLQDLVNRLLEKLVDERAEELRNKDKD